MSLSFFSGVHKKKPGLNFSGHITRVPGLPMYKLNPGFSDLYYVDENGPLNPAGTEIGPQNWTASVLKRRDFFIKIGVACFAPYSVVHGHGVSLMASDVLRDFPIPNAYKRLNRTQGGSKLNQLEGR